MASTNKTTNYELSQYIGTDKPTYLTDYNQDMSKIDAGIHAAKSEADTNSTSIGTLSSLTTDVKTSLVAALNEVDGHADTNAGNIATNTSNIATNTTHIGTVANLTTTSKTDLVVAANEINAKVGNLSNLDTNAKGSTVAAINEVNYNIGLLNINNITDVSESISVTGGTLRSGSYMKVAKNSTGTLGKIYGTVAVNKTSNECTITFNTGLTLDDTITLNNYVTMNGTYNYRTELSIAANGIATMYLNDPSRNDQTYYVEPFFTYFKDFGDVPQPPQV